jgi:DNA-binding NarL/FixJ family response regulator
VLKEPTIRVLVVDDFAFWHDFITKTLQDKPELQVIAHAYDGVEGGRQAQKLQPDLILLDIGLPSLNGIEAARQIREFAPNSRILFLTENRYWEVAQAALSTGASGYVVKSCARLELLPAIDAVLHGEQFVSAGLEDDSSSDYPNLFRRERVVAPSTLQSRDFHDFRLNEDDVAFVDDFAQAIKVALENANASIVIATESHLSNLRQTLRADGVDVDSAVEQSLLILLDVAETFTVGGMIDENRSSGMPEAIVEAVRTAKEWHLHVAVG